MQKLFHNIHSAREIVQELTQKDKMPRNAQLKKLNELDNLLIKCLEESTNQLYFRKTVKDFLEAEGRLKELLTK